MQMEVFTEKFTDKERIVFCQKQAGLGLIDVYKIRYTNMRKHCFEY